MYFNNDWGYVMDIALATIVGAIIAVAGSVILNYLGNKKGYKDIDKKIGQLDNTTLSGQHNKITQEIKQTVAENAKSINNNIGILNNTTLAGQNQEIIKRVDSIAENLQKDRESELRKENFLSSDMKIISNSITNLSEFSNIMKNLNEENMIWKSENQRLLQENEQLKHQISQYNKLDNGMHFSL